MHSKQSTEYAFTHPKCDPIYLIPKCYGTSHNPKAVFEAEKKMIRIDKKKLKILVIQKKRRKCNFFIFGCHHSVIHYIRYFFYGL